MEVLEDFIEWPTSMEKTEPEARSTLLATQAASNLNGLTFINVGNPGDRKRPENRRAVRTHAIREAHRAKRLAETTAFSQSRNRVLGIKSGGHREAASSAFVHGNESRSNGVTEPCNHLRPALPYLNNLIPYSYFAPGGPVLYLKPSTWPFPRPFAMPGADSNERFGSSVFPRQSIWMPSAEIPDCLVIKGPLLGGDVLSWISRSPECLRYRVDLINWVQERLRDPASATDNATVGSIMTLTMWEDGEGSSLDLARHMDGLEKIVNLKGGLTKMQASSPKEFAMEAKVVLFDYIIAVSCATAPRFPALHPPRPRWPHSNFSRDGLFAASPLYGNGDFSGIRVNDRRDQVIILLQKMWHLTNQAVTGNNVSLEDSETLSTLIYSSTAWNSLEEHLDTLSPRNSKHTLEPELAEKTVFDVLLAASIIYHRALSTPPTTFSAPANVSCLQNLFKYINVSAPDQFWLRYPGILLWVLLVGCAAAVKRSERSYFMMFLAKVGIFTELRCWFETESAILKFIAVQQRLNNRH